MVDSIRQTPRFVMGELWEIFNYQHSEVSVEHFELIAWLIVGLTIQAWITGQGIVSNDAKTLLWHYFLGQN
jgi:hypothetical protein